MMRRGLTARCLMAAVLLLALTVDNITGQEDLNVTSEITVTNDTADESTLVEGEANVEDLPGMNWTLEGINGTNAPLSLATTQAPTIPTAPPTSEDGCYTSLNAVYIAISDDDKLFQQKRFVLCPGIVVDVGFLVPGIGIQNGESPIIPRSNTEFLCGEDGSSKNNCLIRGGDFGVVAVPVFFRQDLSVNNVLIKGFTFEGQTQYSSFLATPGGIRFEDCTFRDATNFGPFVLNYDTSFLLNGRRLEGVADFDNPWDAVIDYVEKYRDGTHARRNLEAREADDKAFLPRSAQTFDKDGRRLQTGILEVSMRDCLFTNLQQMERTLGVEYGVLSVKSPDHKLVIEDCTFTDNQYGNQELAPMGYGILIRGAEFEMKGLCFIDNDFRGAGAVLLEQTESPFADDADFIAANYATQQDGDLECPFAAYFATNEDRLISNFTCVPVQTDECGGETLGPPAPTEDAPGDSSATSTFAAVSHFALFGIGLVCLVILP